MGFTHFTQTLIDEKQNDNDDKRPHCLGRTRETIGFYSRICTEWLLFDVTIRIDDARKS